MKATGDGSGRKVGIWLIGARGNVGATIALGVAALAKGLAGATALATDAPPFDDLPFAPWSGMAVGGHDVRHGSLGSTLAEMRRSAHVFSPELLAECAPSLVAFEEDILPGLARHSGRPVEAFADWTRPPAESDAERIAGLRDDIAAFRRRRGLDHVVAVNVASSEPTPTLGPEHASWALLEPTLARPAASGLPASALYGLAAVEAGASYVNFTPSLGLDTPALTERAVELGLPLAGKDGKTGETLMKAVLAPMFRRRRLEVLSWVGHNILGNRDGEVLKDPDSRAGKFAAKDRLLAAILGYEPQTLVSIEHIASMGDRKTAWDHIHFAGFLDTQMTLQFTWQGVDSLLAAPLALDIARWTELASRRGEAGPLGHLAPYFKSPLGCAEPDFFRQWDLLEAYADTVREPAAG